MIYPKLKVVNIKISLFISKPIYIYPLKTIIIKTDTHNSIKITIYNHSPKLINITGIQSFRNLINIKQIVKKLFNVKIKQERIDAIMLNYKSKKHMHINLNKMYKICKNIANYANYNIDYNCELFNAPFFKSSTGKGTILLFSNGSVQIMGCKKKTFIKDNKIFINLLYTLYMIDKKYNTN